MPMALATSGRIWRLSARRRRTTPARWRPRTLSRLEALV